jgi:hypothetical protein
MIATFQSEPAMNELPTACRHTRTRLIAKDKDAEYVECLDCGGLFEIGELSSVFPQTIAPNASGAPPSDDLPVDESLSDA